MRQWLLGISSEEGDKENRDKEKKERETEEWGFECFWTYSSTVFGFAKWWKFVIWCIRRNYGIISKDAAEENVYSWFCTCTNYWKWSDDKKRCTDNPWLTTRLYASFMNMQMNTIWRVIDWFNVMRICLLSQKRMKFISTRLWYPFIQNACVFLMKGNRVDSFERGGYHIGRNETQKTRQRHKDCNNGEAISRTGKCHRSWSLWAY